MSRKDQHYRSLFLSFLVTLLIAGSAVGSVFAWRWMEKPTSFPIGRIQIQGQLTHVTSATLQHIVQSKLKGGFFSLHLFAVKQAILAFPWIADVSFRRIWPDTLVVKVTEQQAVARFGKQGVLNTVGDVFYPDIKTVPQNLPDFEGPIDQTRTLLDFYQTTNLLAKLIGLQVVALHVNAAQSWQLALSNQVMVILGRQSVLSRFKRFITIYPKIIALSPNQKMLSVDLRYENGVAVQYQTAPNSLKK